MFPGPSNGHAHARDLEHTAVSAESNAVAVQRRLAGTAFWGSGGTVRARRATERVIDAGLLSRHFVECQHVTPAYLRGIAKTSDKLSIRLAPLDDVVTISP